MVIDMPEVEGTKTDFQMAEFFVMHKYRRCGVGRWAVFQVLEKHKGRWQLRRHPKNIASVHFWDKVIADYTGGNFGRRVLLHIVAGTNEGLCPPCHPQGGIPLDPIYGISITQDSI